MIVLMTSLHKMATRPAPMGIYGDLARKREAAYDKELEGRCRAWIEGVIGRKLSDPFRESLCDGVALCELVNKLKPGQIPKIHRSTIVMFCRENFGSFQRACVALGCRENETCVFEDVYDNRNMNQFLTNIIALARNTQNKPGYSGPRLEDASGSKPPAGRPLEANPTPAPAASAPRPAPAAAPAPTPSGQWKEAKPCGTFMDAAMAQAQRAKDAGRYTEHGILMNPDDNKNHGQKGPVTNQPAQPPTWGKQETNPKPVNQPAAPPNWTAVPSPSATPAAYQKPAQGTGPGGIQWKQAKPCGSYMDAAMEQAQRAKDAGRYTEHGILMNPDDNTVHGQKWK